MVDGWVGAALVGLGGIKSLWYNPKKTSAWIPTGSLIESG